MHPPHSPLPFLPSPQCLREWGRLAEAGLTPPTIANGVAGERAAGDSGMVGTSTKEVWMAVDLSQVWVGVDLSLVWVSGWPQAHMPHIHT